MKQWQSSCLHSCILCSSPLGEGQQGGGNGKEGRIKYTHTSAYIWALKVSFWRRRKWRKKNTTHVPKLPPKVRLEGVSSRSHSNACVCFVQSVKEQCMRRRYTRWEKCLSRFFLSFGKIVASVRGMRNDFSRVCVCASWDKQTHPLVVHATLLGRAILCPLIREFGRWGLHKRPNDSSMYLIGKQANRLLPVSRRK